MNKNDVQKIYILIFACALTALGFFVTIPLIGLYSIDQFKVSASQAGMLSAIWPATVFVCSFFVGRIGDRYGFLKSIKAGSLICVAAFTLMTTTSHLPIFIIALVLFGIGKSLSESSVRAAIAGATSGAPAEYGRFMRLRYFTVNVVCVGGPFLGYMMYKAFYSYAFGLSAVLYGLGFLLIASFIGTSEFESQTSRRVSTWKENFALFKDRKLQIFVFCGTMVSMTYGCYEAIMPLVVERSHGARPDFAILCALNAITVVVSQIVIMRWFTHVPNRLSVFCGYALMIFGFVLFAVETNLYSTTLVAVIIFSLGESILFPSIDIVINDFAKPDQRGAYFAAAETKQIGFFIGPAAGGFILQHAGAPAMFLSVAALLVVSVVYCSRILKKDESTPKVVEKLGASVAS